MTEMRVVVGSGPGAVGVTHALLQRGFEVTMLDVGETLDAQTAKVVAAMASQQPEQWSDEDKAVIQRVDFATDPGLSPKRLFGSTFSYFNDPGIEAPAAVKLYGSRALGGLSTVWGCALLRATPAELQAWPGPLSGEIAEAYLGIRDLLQPSIGADIFAAGTHLKISQAAQAVWDRYRRSPQLHDDVSVYPTPLTISKACKACNACMYGCVYDYTYSSRTTIEDLFRRNPRFHYAGGIIVEQFSETAETVEVRAVSKATGNRQTFNARQLFLSAGMMASLRILWNSSAGVSRRLQARDSSLFVVPGLTLSGQWGGGARHHGLSHLSVDLTAGPFAEKPAHVQLYFNNPAVADGLKARLGPLNNGPARKLVDIASRFVVAGQGYLHSDFCHRLELDCDDAGIIRASVVHNPATDGFIDAALSQFARQMRKLGIYFVNPAASITPYGGSKTAGALPHAAQPDPSTTDQLGRPFGAKNVFVVDMTVMPSIPARNHTLTMFANALRIGQSA
jgi:choline dehydrogenase-like flavoprotein